MSLKHNKELVLRFFDEVFNARQPQRVDEFIARNAVAEGFGAKPFMLREQLHQRSVMLYVAFPDCRITVQDITAEGDMVVIRGTLSGTHQGVFKHLSPTGKSFSIRLMHWMRIVDNQILEYWSICEDLERVLST